MPEVHGFSPVSSSASRVLILGSMPGKASLREQAYYAHARNAFWGVVEALFSIDRMLPYRQRCSRLAQTGVALWDVLQTCTRSSSLDSDIVTTSIVTNDFSGFLSAHAGIAHIFFNGAMAEKTYLRHVKPVLPVALSTLPTTRLPSTSPAHAAMSFAQKLDAWQQVREVLESQHRLPPTP